MKTAPELPPAIQILLDEPFPSLSSPAKVKAYFKKLLPELRQQATWTSEKFAYFDSVKRNTADQFVITASSGLNPLCDRGICRETNCRIHAAEQFARTIGLHADIAVIPDTLSARLFFRDKFSDRELFEFANDTLVIRTLAPLIRAGVVRFASQFFGFCEKHYQEFEQVIDGSFDAVLRDAQSELSFSAEKDAIVVDTGKLYEPPLVGLMRLGKEDKKRLSRGERLEDIGRALYEPKLRESVRDAFLYLKTASKLKSVLFSSSRLDLLAVRELERTRPDFSDIEAWEAARATELPWIKDLSVPQVLQLREEASIALPRFRQAMSASLSGPHEKIGERSDAVIHELREQAAEVAAELKALSLPSERRFRNVAGVLGLTISVYGFGAAIIPAPVALGTLVSLLGLLHGSARKDEQEANKVMSRPGYVLVKAKELLSHHDGKDR
jgi:hypothetical protein